MEANIGESTMNMPPCPSFHPHKKNVSNDYLVNQNL
jgi:transposase-like protein